MHHTHFYIGLCIRSDEEMHILTMYATEFEPLSRDLARAGIGNLVSKILGFSAIIMEAGFLSEYCGF